MIEASKSNPRAVFFAKFASAFCDACRQSRVALDSAVKSMNKCVDVVELDSDVADSTADSFNVKELPTVVAVKGGKVIGKVTGAQESQAYVRFFQKHTE